MKMESQFENYGDYRRLIRISIVVLNQLFYRHLITNNFKFYGWLNFKIRVES